MSCDLGVVLSTIALGVILSWEKFLQPISNNPKAVRSISITSLLL